MKNKIFKGCCTFYTKFANVSVHTTIFRAV